MRVESHHRIDRDVLFASVSYGITLIRFLTAVIVGGSILFGASDRSFIVTSIVLIMGSDYLDGLMFDKSNLVFNKDWRINRRIADSVCDRLVIQLICIPLAVTNGSFLWLYLALLGREVVISTYISKQLTRGFLVYPRSISKIACAMVGVAVIAFMVSSTVVTTITAILMIALSLFALLDYARRIQGHVLSILPPKKSRHGLEEIF